MPANDPSIPATAPTATEMGATRATDGEEEALLLLLLLIGGGGGGADDFNRHCESRATTGEIRILL